MTVPLSDQEIEDDLARLRASMAPGPAGTPIHISSGYGEFTLRVVEQLRRQRDEARTALRGLLSVVEKSFEPSQAALDNSGWVEGRALKAAATTARAALGAPSDARS